MIGVWFKDVTIGQTFEFSGLCYTRVEEGRDAFGRYNARNVNGDKHYFNDHDYVYIG